MKRASLFRRILRYILAIGLIVAVAVVFQQARESLDTALVALLFLLPVGLSTAFWGLGPGIASGLAAFLAFNYLFIRPYYSFTVHRPADLVVLMVFLVVVFVISQLLGRARAGMEAARLGEREATHLYELSTALTSYREPRAIVGVVATQLQALFDSDFIEVDLTGPPPLSHHLPAGVEAPGRTADLTVPIRAVKGVLGEIRLWRASAPVSDSEKRLALTAASQCAVALERIALAHAESRARILEESDRFKSSLLSSVSHELRTPLATIKAAASSLRTGEVNWNSTAREELLAAIDNEADYLNILVGNLLDMTRIESGALRPQREWTVLSEIVHSTLARMRHLTTTHQIEVEVPDDLPLIPVDFLQMEQVFTNLISNSTKYAPAGTVIRIGARLQSDSELLVEVSNQGPHVPPEHLDRIFDKFYRITAADRVTGTGLGLSICKGIIEAHGGRIWAVNLPAGFAFNFTLPLMLDGAPPPRVQPESETP